MGNSHGHGWKLEVSHRREKLQLYILGLRYFTWALFVHPWNQPGNFLSDNVVKDVIVEDPDLQPKLGILNCFLSALASGSELTESALSSTLLTDLI